MAITEQYVEMDNPITTEPKTVVEDIVIERTINPPKQQVGGSHYEVAIQPIEYIEANNLGFHEGSIIKYITRYKNKNGLEDLEKCKWYIDRLIELNK